MVILITLLRIIAYILLRRQRWGIWVGSIIGWAASKEAAPKRAILDSGDYNVLHQMITKPVDIHATVRALQNAVPKGCETLAPPNPTVSGVRTMYFGDVRVVEAFDPIEGLMIRRADLYYLEK